MDAGAKRQCDWALPPPGAGAGGTAGIGATGSPALLETACVLRLELQEMWMGHLCLFWTPGHEGVVGNESADVAANKGPGAQELLGGGGMRKAHLLLLNVQHDGEPGRLPGAVRPTNRA